MKKLTEAKPQRRNANRHTQRGMGALERSIQEDGWIGAITVAADGETFDGSGTTLIAAQRTGRRCYGMEIEPKYCDVILRRAEAEGIGPIELVSNANA